MRCLVSSRCLSRRLVATTSFQLRARPVRSTCRIAHGLDVAARHQSGKPQRTRPDDAAFVKDRPISMVDPTPGHPWTGNAWRSSGNAISFYPLSSTKGLFMTPGDHGLATATSRASQVRRLNLMTYGWAERFVYGTSQEAVVRVRRQARYVVVDLDEPAGTAAGATTKVTDALAGKVAKDPLESRLGR